MSDNSLYQQARGHLAYLRMAAAAEALPAELEYATSEKLGHTAFLERILQVEVAAAEIRGGPLSSASPRCLAVPAGGLRLRRPAVDRQEAGQRAGHAAVLRGRHQRAVHRATRGGQDHAGRRPGPGLHRRGLSHLLHNGGRPGWPAVTGRPSKDGGPPPCASSPDPDCWSSTRSATCPWPTRAAAALFQVITQRYLKSSTVLTTNLGVGSWGKIYDDPMVAAAMLDRLLHR